MRKLSRREILTNTAATSVFLNTTSYGAKAAETGGVVRPEAWGAIGDGAHDDTKALQSAIDQAAGRTILLTGRSYKVSGDKAGVLNIPSSGIRLRGQGTQKAVISCATDDAYILKGSAVRNVDISNIGFEGSTERCVSIGITGGSSNVRISECTARYCGLYHGTTSAKDYAGANRGNSPTGVQIQNCTGTGNPKRIAGSTFISLHYHSDTHVSGCRGDNYEHGIMWWGGDSAANANGSPNSERKASDITISDCRISDVGGGGIWGSMGRNIKVTNCTVDTCGDVGFDAEGCQEVTFSGGKVRNCANGCLATFWGARNIVFENIDIELSGAHKLAFRSYNATLQAAFAESVRIIGGSIICQDGIGWLDQANGPLDSFLMRGTHLKNVIVEMTQQNIHDVTIDGVTIEITIQAPKKSGPAAICIGHLQQDGRSSGTGIVRNCKITSLTPQPGLGDCAISFIGADANADTIFSADGNRISGFGTAFSLTDSAGKSVYRLRDNQFGRGILKRAGLSSRSILDMK